ncbi:MAG: hypothetical protein ACRC5T_12510 [Cetobacterium sp.]
MEKNIFISDYFIPTIREYFNITDDTQDLKIKIMVGRIIDEALNFTNQTLVLEEMENIILDFGIKSFEASKGNDALKSLSVGKVKMEYGEGIKSSSDITTLYNALKPFKRMRTL